MSGKLWHASTLKKIFTQQQIDYCGDSFAWTRVEQRLLERNNTVATVSHEPEWISGYYGHQATFETLSHVPEWDSGY